MGNQNVSQLQAWWLSDSFCINSNGTSTLTRINRDKSMQIEEMSRIFAIIAVIDIAAEIILENGFH